MNLPDKLNVDTSVLIDYLRRRPGFLALESVGAVYLLAMVLAELKARLTRNTGSEAAYNLALR